MNIKEAMTSYFDKLQKLYQDEYGTLPTAVYDDERDQSLYVGEEDDEGYIQWTILPAEKIELEGLCEELTEFYSSFYYCQLEGKIGNSQFYFPFIFNKTEAIKEATFALRHGAELFPDEDNAIIAMCTVDGVDGLLLVYNQKDNSLFIYDCDRKERYKCNYSLVSLLSEMEAMI